MDSSRGEREHDGADVGQSENAPPAGDTSAAARSGPTRATQRKRERLFVVLLLLIIVGAGVSLLLSVRRYYLPRWRAVEEPSAAYMDIAPAVGSSAAPVKVQALLEHCLVGVQDLVLRMGTTYPELVHGQFLDLYSTASIELLDRHGEEHCAGVFINGKNRFDLETANGRKIVYFHGNPGGTYSLEDLSTVVKQQIVAAGAPVPSDFDEHVNQAGPPPPLGSDDAKLKIELCLAAMDAELTSLLGRIVTAFEDKIRVEFIGYWSEAGVRSRGRLGVMDSFLLFNGEYRLTVPPVGEQAERELRFLGLPGSAYDLDDVLMAMRLQLVELYGLHPSSVDATLSALRSSPPAP